MNEKIAVIGMGQMGSAMAAHLVDEGRDVLGYDISQEARAALRVQGVAMADTVAETLAGRSIVLSSLPKPEHVREAFLAPGGLLAMAEKGSLFIELSSIDPHTMRAVAAEATNKGFEILDCPVSGSPVDAREGKLILMVGGEKATISNAEPMLELLGATWKYSGKVGDAKVVKIVNNMMSMGNIAIASEAFALGTAAGVDAATLYDVLSVSGGRSHHLIKRFPNALKGDFSPGFKMELGEKDVALGIELGRSLDQPTPVAATVREIMGLALTQGFRGQDFVAMLKMYQDWTKSAGSAK